jgi:peptidylprolyl isomerase
VRRATILLALLIAAIALVACGDDDDPPAPQDPLTDTSVKPVIPRPSGSPPNKLQVEDIVKGKGRAAKKGDTVTMQYVGVAWSTGVEFDASWDSGEPFKVKLGEGKVIKGWDAGIPGMKAGGRRELTIPADQAYGAQGSPPSIGPNEALRFIVDLRKVKQG